MHVCITPNTRLNSYTARRLDISAPGEHCELPEVADTEASSEFRSLLRPTPLDLNCCNCPRGDGRRVNSVITAHVTTS